MLLFPSKTNIPGDCLYTGNSEMQLYHHADRPHYTPTHRAANPGQSSQDPDDTNVNF